MLFNPPIISAIFLHSTILQPSTSPPSQTHAENRHGEKWHQYPPSRLTVLASFPEHVTTFLRYILHGHLAHPGLQIEMAESYVSMISPLTSQ
jgi:hypothetical protein